MPHDVPWDAYQALGPAGALVAILVVAAGLIVLGAAAGIGVGMYRGFQRVVCDMILRGYAAARGSGDREIRGVSQPPPSSPDKVTTLGKN
jgi:hypothetical protein